MYPPQPAMGRYRSAQQGQIMPSGQQNQQPGLNPGLNPGIPPPPGPLQGLAPQQMSQRMPPPWNPPAVAPQQTNPQSPQMAPMNSAARDQTSGPQQPMNSRQLQQKQHNPSAMQ